MKRVVLALALGIAAASYAQAAPLQWSLDGVTFSDGGTATGSFDFDAATTTYSDIDITTTAGSGGVAGATYTALAPNPPYVPTDGGVFLVTTTEPDLAGTPLLGFFLPDPLTELGGAIPLTNNLVEYTCVDATCQSANPLRTADAGYISTLSLGQAVPEPASLALLGAGVIGLAVARRRRASSPA